MPKHTVMYVNYFFNKTRKRKKKRKLKVGKKRFQKLLWGVPCIPLLCPGLDARRERQKDRETDRAVAFPGTELQVHMG